jgi:hypothetical protein
MTDTSIVRQSHLSLRACIVNHGSEANYMTGWTMKELRLKHRTHLGCKQLDFNRFLMLPTDVLYGVRLFVPCWDSSLPFVQIFEWLHPVDLYHLMQSTSTFRGVILNRTYRGVWKSSYCRYDDLPTCPEDVSEPQWTSLLFGPDTCDVSSLQILSGIRLI